MPGKGTKSVDSEYIEYTIQVKDEKSSLSTKELSYDPILLSKENVLLKEEVAFLFEKFQETHLGEESPEIIIKAKMVWQA